ncbi:restriction endonuclease subunit S [Parageobacillus thermoglucosidasius]|uniref:restriction endonuclease subunit S n=1 Tax=Parageobacillus thermoglucosidasius TaxID=1426 RepID=UPI0027EC8B23|nr:restriction endonuclease subunit S [Parageobacillus thermoglucosidasius]
MNNKLERELEKALHIGENDLPQIPKSWIYVKLSAVSNRIGGGTPSRKNPEYFIGDIPWITVADIPKDSKRPFTISNSRERITEKAIAESSAKLIPTGSVVVSTRVSVGKVGINDKPICTNQDFSSFSFYKIDSRFAAYFLFTVAEDLKRKAIGATIKGIKTKDLDDLRFPLPPLVEQKRIVEKLDYSLNIIDKIEKDLAKAKELLKKRHESLLQKAFRGELVKREENDQSTLDLLNIKVSSNTDENNPYDIPENWVWLELGDCGVITGGGTPSKKVPSFWNGNILWVSPKDMKREKINDTEDKITELAIEKSSVKLIPKNSVLFVVRSGILRHSLPVAINDVELTVNQDIKAITPHEFINVSYLFYAFKCFEKSWLQEASKIGATVESLDMEKVKKLKVPVPPLSEQLKIIERLEKEFEKEKAIVQSIERAEEKLQKMRQSLLQKAFRGELVEQRPEEGTGLDLLKEIIEEKLKSNKEK